MREFVSLVLCIMLFICIFNVNVFAAKDSTGIVYTSVGEGDNPWLITSNSGGLFSAEDIYEGTITFNQYIFNESDTDISFRLQIQVNDGGWTAPENASNNSYVIEKNSGAWVKATVKVNGNNKVTTAKGEFDVSNLFLRFNFSGKVKSGVKLVIACEGDLLKNLNKGIHAQGSMFEKKLTSDVKYKEYPEYVDDTLNKDFHVSGAFSDNMVIQRNAKVSVWGFSTYIGKEVAAQFNGQRKVTTVQSDGTWIVILDEMNANKNGQDMVLFCNGITQKLTNVLIGDVFFISGQSNAEKELGRCGNEYSDEYKENLIASANGNIRFFTQHRNDTLVDKSVWHTPQSEPINGNKWAVESLSTANQFSSIGFFFAHKMYDSLEVPIGMIMVAANGAPLYQLMSADATTKANYKMMQGEVPSSAMYNALMHPFIKMSVKGMLFYHGENERYLAISDYGKYNQYLKVYIDDLREKNGNKFSLYSVQLSSHTTEDWSGIQEQRAVQFDGIKLIEKAGLVVSVDYGIRPEDTDAGHPNYKEPIGLRLAALALTMDYGIGDSAYVLSPEPISALKTENGIVVKFKNVGDGLKKIGQHDTLSGFRVIVNNKYVEVNAEIISKDEVLLDTKVVSGITGIAYGIEQLAFVDYPEGNGDLTYVANLGNSNNLPSPTFKMKIMESIEADQVATPTTDVNGEGEPTKAPEKSTNVALWIGIGVAVVLLVAAIIFLIKKRLR